MLYLPYKYPNKYKIDSLMSMDVGAFSVCYLFSLVFYRLLFRGFIPAQFGQSEGLHFIWKFNVRICWRHFVADMENFDLFDQKVINMIQHDSVIMQVYDHLSLEVICDDNANCAVLNLLCHMEMDDSTLCSVVLSQSLGGSSCHILPCLRQCGWSFLSYGVSLACGPFAMELKLLRTCSAAFATWLLLCNLVSSHGLCCVKPRQQLLHHKLLEGVVSWQV